MLRDCGLSWVASIIFLQYSRLSLSRLQLSRITAYLEVKIWSLFKHENLTKGYKILWKRGETVHKCLIYRKFSQSHKVLRILICIKVIDTLSGVAALPKLVCPLLKISTQKERTISQCVLNISF